MNKPTVGGYKWKEAFRDTRSNASVLVKDLSALMQETSDPVLLRRLSSMMVCATTLSLRLDELKGYGE